MKTGKLTDEARTHAVRCLACFDTATAVAHSIRQEFGIDITPQSVERYDPTRVAGKRLSTRWRQLFEVTREAFLKETANIGISHRAVRLRALQRMSERAEDAENFGLAAQLLEQAAKEMGDAYTNRRELTGKNGTPLPPEPGKVVLYIPDNGRSPLPGETHQDWVQRMSSNPTRN